MTIGERVKLARRKKGMTQEDLAKLLGYKSKSSVTHIENGRDIPRAMVSQLAKILDVTPSYLMGWEDEKPTDPLTELTANFDNIKPVQLKRFPMLGEIACGEPIWADEDHESYVMADMDIEADFCLRAKGDSMINARIYDGDVVFIKEMPIVENGDIAAVIIDNEATLKRFYYDKENNYLQLIAENPLYKPLVYRNEQLNEIRVLGKAVYFMSAL
ncbi:MAG: helix-turn-helix domain-containing protein [Ruminococcus sp.]|nr:helix-turn-helix domain-containing protein [Ruminococcus sp.]